MGDYAASAPWNDSSLKGCRKFLERIAGLTDIMKDADEPALESPFHKTIKKVTEDIRAMKFNTAIAALMGLINDIYAKGSLGRNQLITFIKLVSPFAPHICEEIYEMLGFISKAKWPVYDESKTVDATIEIAVQINGKLKGTVTLQRDVQKDDAIAAAKQMLGDKLAGTIVKEIYVPGRIVNIVVKP